MNMKRCASLAAGLALCLFLASCISTADAVKVPLNHYSPNLKSDLSKYKGKPIYLMNFDNQAKNTTNFYFLSLDRKFAYHGDSLIHNYFWYSFDKALKNLGMVVSDPNRPDAAAPGVWLTLKSITDALYVVEVKIQTRWEPFFTKTYEVAGDASVGDGRTPAELEKRAYLMTDRLIEGILTDVEFQNAFFKAVKEMASTKGT